MMPIWSEILAELGSSVPPNYDAIRRKYLVELHKITKRPVILYGSAWIQKPNCSPSILTINDEDIQAFMEVTYGIGGNELDLILHSPGGSPEATEAIVSYLRSRFSNIRVIVPQIAMSAATLLACSANEIILGKHSSLGPTDPQMLIPTSNGIQSVAAQAVLDQFDMARQECSDPKKLAAWLPMLQQYGPDLLIQCENALKMTKELVKTWLQTYMFSGDETAEEKAILIANWLSNHQQFKSHNRHISREELKTKGFLINYLENNQDLQDKVLSVYHSMTHTFGGTAATKLVENHLGKAFVKLDNSVKSPTNPIPPL